MATTQEEGHQEEAHASGLADFSKEEMDKFYELAANRLNEAMAKTLDKSQGNAPVYVILAQKGSEFANYLTNLDPQLYTLMNSKSAPIEVKAKQMQEMLQVYNEKNLNDIGFKEPKKKFLDKVRTSTLLGAFMGAVLGFFASKQIISNVSAWKSNKEAPSNKMKTLQNLAVVGSTLVSALLVFIGIDKMPLLSQKKKEVLHEEVSKLSLGDLNDRIHQLNGEIRADHGVLLEDVKKAAIKADVLRMMKEVVAARAKDQKQQLRNQTDDKVEAIDGAAREADKELHKQVQEVVKEAVGDMGVTGRVNRREPVERRPITPEAMLEERENPNKGRTALGV